MSNQNDFNIKFTLKSTIDAIKWFKAQIQYVLNPTKETLEKSVNVVRTLTASKDLYSAYKALTGSDKKITGKSLAKKQIAEHIDPKTGAPYTEEQRTKNQILNDKERDLTDQYNNVSVFKEGKMYLFHYDPKTKEKLPYWDTFPLIIMMGFCKDGFYGINFHYLPVEQRMILLSNLLKRVVLLNGLLNRLDVSYDKVKNVPELKLFRPCFKKYLFSHIKGVIKLIPPEDWGYAAALPVENFKKKSKQEVWIDSMKSAQ